MGAINQNGHQRALEAPSTQSGDPNHLRSAALGDRPVGVRLIESVSQVHMNWRVSVSVITGEPSRYHQESERAFSPL